MQERIPIGNREKPPRKGEAGKRRQTHTVGFRLDSYYLTLLERGASAYGISIHEYARQRLQELLDRQEEARLLEEVGAVQSDVRELREDIARTLEVLLVNTTKSEGAAIREWINTHLRRG